MSNCQPTYSIKEVSTMFSLAASTLRYYEELGLLGIVPRSTNKQRIYNQTHIHRLRGIQCFKQTGLSITKMQEFFRYEESLSDHATEILSLVEEHQCNILLEITRLQEELLHINDKVAYYTAVKNAVQCNVPLPNWEDVIQ